MTIDGFKGLLMFAAFCGLLLLAVLAMRSPVRAADPKACVIDLNLQSGHAQLSIRNCHNLKDILRQFGSSNANSTPKATSRWVVLPNNERQLCACPLPNDGVQK